MRADDDAHAGQSSTVTYIEVKEQINKYIHENQRNIITEITAPEMNLKQKK
jgi:hypothetical protein